MLKALIVEDEADVRELMSLHLKREGVEVVAVENGEEGLRTVAVEKFGLVVLDWMLPGVSGLEICKRLRSTAASARVSILMVTARADSADVITGLDAGADDYITKPFELPIFLARVRALRRRFEALGEQGARKLKNGDLTIDLDAYEVHCAGTLLQLTPSEFKLLAALMQNEGRALSRERLIDLVQGENVTVVYRAIDTHVFGLRKKLGACSDVLETIRGVGYRVRAP
jgi:two-component system, OmpR family, phosphate regulon response regulator PhoB